MVCLNNMEKNTEKQEDQRIYAIILTDLNEKIKT